jgi:hypothetical protein
MKNRNYKVDNARKLLGISKHATAEDAKKNTGNLPKYGIPT